MPITFGVFTFASMALIGIPILPGFASKWAIASHATMYNNPLAWAGVAALMISALLTGLYQMGVVVPAFFPRKGHQEPDWAVSVTDPGWRMVASLLVLCVLVLALGLGADWLYSVLTRVAAGLV